MTKKRQNKSHIYVRQYVFNRVYEKSDLKQVTKKTYLEIIDISETNGTFVKKVNLLVNFNQNLLKSPN